MISLILKKTFPKKRKPCVGKYTIAASKFVLIYRAKIIYCVGECVFSPMAFNTRLLSATSNWNIPKSIRSSPEL